MIAYFDEFQIELTEKQAHKGHHVGECFYDVQELLKNTNIKRQLKKISDAKLCTELKHYGAWDDTELKDRKANENRIIWIASGRILDEITERKETHKNAIR